MGSWRASESLHVASGKEKGNQGVLYEASHNRRAPHRWKAHLVLKLLLESQLSGQRNRGG
eukprot:366775-Pelagomonas_calceolata.AAC.2